MDENQIIEANMGLVYLQLNKYRLTHDPEAFSRALEALWSAVQTYKENSSTKFSTYACVCIYNALGCYIRHLKRKRQLEIISYDVPISENHSLADVMPGDIDTEEAYLRIELSEELHKAIHKVACSFSSVSTQQAVTYWFEQGCQPTQQELADKYNLSQSYVSRVLSMAKHRLKKELEDYVCNE